MEAVTVNFDYECEPFIDDNEVRLNPIVGVADPNKHRKRSYSKLGTCHRFKERNFGLGAEEQTQVMLRCDVVTSYAPLICDTFTPEESHCFSPPILCRRGYFGGNKDTPEVIPRSRLEEGPTYLFNYPGRGAAFIIG
jgi:hypothetical protein